MPKKQTKIIIIDALALIFRAYYALPPLAKKDGTVVNAVYGFMSTLFNVYRDYKPDYLCVAFDSPKITFRKEMFDGYKAQREAPPEDLPPQIPMIMDLLKKMNIKTYIQPGWEADDVIGSICATKSIDNKDTISYILTGDLDTLQLVDDNTKVITFKRGMSETIEYDEHGVELKYDGLKPNQLIDMKALKGDQSDNIPGIKGIGEVTAIKLIKQFGTLEKLYENIDKAEVSERIKGLLRDQKEMAMISKKLSTIVTDLKLNFDLKDCEPQPYNRSEIIADLQDFEFKSLIPRMPEFGVTESKNAEPKEEMTVAKNVTYQTVANEIDFKKFLAELWDKKLFAFDTETTGQEPFTSSLLGISFCWEEGKAYYVSIKNKKGDGLFTAESDNTAWLNELAPLFADPEISKIGHNLKFDAEILEQAGVPVNGMVFDTMIAAYLLSPGERNYDLLTLASSELGLRKTSFTELVGSGSKQIKAEDVELKQLSAYSCEDADMTFRLYKKFTPALKESGVRKVMEEIEMPLLPVLAAMEKNGVIVDAELLNDLSKTVTADIKELESKIYKIAGKEFNIASPLQLQEILFDVLQLSTVKIAKTKTGLSTAASELEKMQGLHPIIDLILSYRELAKLKSTYLDALPLLINPKTGRIHTSFNQTIAATGRLSSTNPNLQNIPVRTDLGNLVRKSFIVPKGYKMLSADYSQIELRLAAHFSGDKTMMKIFQDGKDIHTTTAAIIHGIPESEVTKQIRSTAKEVNFGIIYGLGSTGLAQRTGMPRDEAKKFVENYFLQFPSIKEYIQSSIDQAREKGYAETFTGRKRWLPDLMSNNGMLRSSSERIAINMPLQGAQADLIKMAMIKVQAGLTEVSAGSRMILQIHDQLIFEVPEKDLDAVAAFVKKTMEDIYKFKVPILVDLSVGDNWGELEGYKI